MADYVGFRLASTVKLRVILQVWVTIRSEKTQNLNYSVFDAVYYESRTFFGEYYHVTLNLSIIIRSKKIKI